MPIYVRSPINLKKKDKILINNLKNDGMNETFQILERKDT
jgi:hypothetical protein